MSNLDVDDHTRLDVSDVLVCYATAVDTRDWDLFRMIFTDDCHADYGEVGSVRERYWTMATPYSVAKSRNLNVEAWKLLIASEQGPALV